MITSSLPPEWKVSIASAVLLAGGLLALRFPAEHDVMSSHVPRTQSVHRTPTPIVQESARLVSETVSSSRNKTSTQYIDVDEFVESGKNEDSLPSPPVSTPVKPDRFAVLTVPPTNSPAVSSNLPSPDYRTMSYHDHGAQTDSKPESVSQNVSVISPEYKPFQSAIPMSPPEPNPAFASAASTPPSILFSVPPKSTLLQTPGPTTELAALSNHGAQIRVLPSQSIGYVARRNDSSEPKNNPGKADKNASNPSPGRNVISARGNAVILPDRFLGNPGR